MCFNALNTLASCLERIETIVSNANCYPVLLSAYSVWPYHVREPGVFGAAQLGHTRQSPRGGIVYSTSSYELDVVYSSDQLSTGSLHSRGSKSKWC
jgi:hypothetical protein